MYLIMERESGIFHFSLSPVSESSILRALILNMNENKIVLNKKYIFIALEIPHSSSQFMDYRFVFNNKFLKEFIFLLITKIINIVYFFKNKLKKNKLKRVISLTLLILFSFFIFDLGMIEEKTYNLFANNIQNESIFTWKNYFIKSKIAQKVAHRKNFFIHEKIPSIRGITDFKVLPLYYKNKNIEIYNGFLAVSYSRILTVKGEESFIKNPVEYCSKKGLSIFHITEKDEILIFESSNIKDKFRNDFFAIFSENELLNRSKNKNDYCNYLNEFIGENN
ncbi:hypothetical protein [Fluviispira multicolorata]|uniref:Uncharacterized protein n=1 Tax=Fluviispira multicolorata TaxID=2654512 RepID=A0A833N2R1_9BACT|nr:hypothetical protein [Fluviispira multicolorata]KAB8033218.1 hypothetical protein GCL57_00545 [Fluviispira multicolorata]